MSRGLPAVPAACLGATSRHFLSCATPSCNRPASVYRSHFCTACVHTAIPSSPRPSTHLPRRHRPPRPLPWVASRAPPTPAPDACVLSPSHSTASHLPPPCTYNNSPSLSHCPRARTPSRFYISAPPATSTRFLRHSHRKPDRRRAYRCEGHRILLPAPREKLAYHSTSVTNRHHNNDQAAANKLLDTDWTKSTSLAITGPSITSHSDEPAIMEFEYSPSTTRPALLRTCFRRLTPIVRLSPSVSCAERCRGHPRSPRGSSSTRDHRILHLQTRRSPLRLLDFHVLTTRSLEARPNLCQSLASQ